jgi:hypothetical protein
MVKAFTYRLEYDTHPSSIDTTTDALAIAVRDGLRHRPHMASTLQAPAERLAAVLRQELPDIPQEHIAAILLHLGRCLPPLLPELRRQRTITEHLIAEYVAALVGVIGEEIHGSIQRRQAPSIKMKG